MFKELAKVACFSVGLQVTEDVVLMTQVSCCAFKSFHEVTFLSAVFFYISYRVARKQFSRMIFFRFRLPHHLKYSVSFAALLDLGCNRFVLILLKKKRF